MRPTEFCPRCKLDRTTYTSGVQVRCDHCGAYVRALGAGEERRSRRMPPPRRPSPPTDAPPDGPKPHGPPPTLEDGTPPPLYSPLPPGHPALTQFTTTTAAPAAADELDWETLWDERLPPT